MRSQLISGLAAGLIALGSTAALADAGANQAQGNPGQASQAQRYQAPGSTASGQAGSSAHAQYPISGVVTNVDKTGHQLAVVAPTTSTTDVQQIGQNILIDKDVNFQALAGPVAPDVKVIRDGKSASFNDLKEGDMIRASYDPKNQTFTNIRAVSSNEVKNNPNQASVDLKNTGPMGGQPGGGM